MFPFHVRLGPFALSPGEIFATLGVAIAAWICRRRMAGLGVSTGLLVDLGLGTLLGGAVGARLYYILPLWIRGAASTGEIVSSWSDGSGYYGGFIGGSIAVASILRFKKIPILPALDAIAAVIPLGFAVGKIGCFLSGCCYGRLWASGVAFRAGSLCWQTQRGEGVIPLDATTCLPVHPTQLYELALGLALFVLLAALQRRVRTPGVIYLAYILGYGAWRFAIEFFRSDPGRHGFGAGPLSDSQVTSIVLGLAAAAGLVFLATKKSAETATPDRNN